jgi:hypothetical protein
MTPVLSAHTTTAIVKVRASDLLWRKVFWEFMGPAVITRNCLDGTRITGPQAAIVNAKRIRKQYPGIRTDAVCKDPQFASAGFFCP